MKNVIYIRFLNKKNFPPGKWKKEPDLCQWYHLGYNCLAIRDMSLGIWKSFVGVDETHPLYSKSLDDVLKVPPMMEAYIDVYGGICNIGKLPTKYKEEASTLWWLGLETSHGGDFMPLLKLDHISDDVTQSLTEQSYKDLTFIRRETNKLASYISKVK